MLLRHFCSLLVVVFQNWFGWTCKLTRHLDGKLASAHVVHDWHFLKRLSGHMLLLNNMGLLVFKKSVSLCIAQKIDLNQKGELNYASCISLLLSYRRFSSKGLCVAVLFPGFITCINEIQESHTTAVSKPSICTTYKLLI